MPLFSVKLNQNCKTGRFVSFQVSADSYASADNLGSLLAAQMEPSMELNHDQDREVEAGWWAEVDEIPQEASNGQG